MNLVTAAELAEVLRVTRAHVYERQAFYGAFRLGEGRNAPLRFDLDAVLERIACSSGRASLPGETAVVEPRTRRRQRPGSGTTVELLPVRGRTVAP